jgi:hypothetical protein
MCTFSIRAAAGTRPRNAFIDQTIAGKRKCLVRLSALLIARQLRQD